jgi:hypothetical protein
MVFLKRIFDLGKSRVICKEVSIVKVKKTSTQGIEPWSRDPKSLALPLCYAP